MLVRAARETSSCTDNQSKHISINITSKRNCPGHKHQQVCDNLDRNSNQQNDEQTMEITEPV